MHDLRQELERVRVLLRERSAEALALMELIPAAVFISHDAACDRIDGNRPACELLRVARGNEVPLSLRQAIVQKALITSELELVYGDGDTRYVYGHAAPLMGERGEAAGAVAVFLDVTDRKRATSERERLLEEVRAARLAAEDAARVKDEFLSVLSHELRTPLNAILAWTYLLRNAQTPRDHFARGVEVIARNAEAQARMVSDLLDISRLNTGRVSLSRQPLSIRALAREAIEAHLSEAEAKGIRLEAVMASEGRVDGDPARLKQVLRNVVSNAIRHTPESGEIRVHLHQDATSTWLSVSDTGAGIDPLFLPHVFERFRQLDSSPERSHRGLGLGLAIARHLLELHGGSIEATSEGVGKGATFTIRLPVA